MHEGRGEVQKKWEGNTGGVRASSIPPHDTVKNENCKHL